MSFEARLQEELESRPSKKSDGFKRMRRILADTNDRRRERRLEAMKLKASEKLDIAVDAIDWDEIDWDKMLAFLEKIIKLLMSLFGQ